MNDAEQQNADAEVTPDKPVPNNLLSVGAAESSTEVPERLPKPRASFLETVYYWVIARS